jgi:hypothetical protein
LHVYASNTLSAPNMGCLLLCPLPGLVIHTSWSSGLGVLETGLTSQEMPIPPLYPNDTLSKELRV